MQTYKLGDSVKVKDGVCDPDFPNLMLSGWQGRVIGYGEKDDETGEILVDIAWDSITLKNMPPEYIKKCVIDGLDWTSCNLYAIEVEATTVRDTEYDVDDIIDCLSEQYEWADFGEVGEIIAEAIAPADPDDEEECFRAWQQFLQKKLTFPFDAIVSPDFEGDFIEVGETVKAHSFANLDEMLGVMVKIEANKKTVNFPLCDLDILNELSDNFMPVHAYAVWYANR